jgi:transcription elongation factor GreB
MQNLVNDMLFNVFFIMKSNLITRAGHDKLVAELKQLWHEERPEITKKVNWAASLGDQ